MLPYINDFPIEFRDYIASEIIPRYAGFDKAHRCMLLPLTMTWDSVRDGSSTISFQEKYYGQTRS